MKGLRLEDKLVLCYKTILGLLKCIEMPKAFLFNPSVSFWPSQITFRNVKYHNNTKFECELLKGL